MIVILGRAEEPVEVEDCVAQLGEHDPPEPSEGEYAEKNLVRALGEGEDLIEWLKRAKDASLSNVLCHGF